jgi:tetrapyrrole methylase family protein/MazG family protein
MKSFAEVVKVMSRLRGAKGCPWDKEQTHQSLLKYLFEEADEVKKSIRKRDWENLEEELGDILMQVLFHAQIAKEAGRFDIDDVVRGLTRKLTLRHPHVFGYKAEHRRLLKKRKLKTVEDILESWDLLKEVSKQKRR